MLELNRPFNRRLIGLTGGIATGKSTVSDYLSKTYHLPILDADEYAKEAVNLGSPILKSIQNRYGPKILQPTGELNRQQLGEIIFADPKEKQWLETQIHPWVIQRLQQELQVLASSPMVVLSIPLLFEANLTYLVNEIWVVYAHPEQQIQRLQSRNGFTLAQAQQRLQSQWPLTQKIPQADRVLDNTRDLSHLYQQINQAVKLTTLSATDSLQPLKTGF